MFDELDIECDLRLRPINTFYSKVKIFPSYKYTTKCSVNHSNCILVAVFWGWGWRMFTREHGRGDEGGGEPSRAQGWFSTDKRIMESSAQPQTDMEAMFDNVWIAEYNTLQVPFPARKLQFKLFYTLSRFLSSFHPVIWSLGHSVTWSLSHSKDDLNSDTDRHTNNIRTYRSASQTKLCKVKKF